MSERIVSRPNYALPGRTPFAADAALRSWTSDRAAAHRFPDHWSAKRAIDAACTTTPCGIVDPYLTARYAVVHTTIEAAAAASVGALS